MAGDTASQKTPRTPARERPLVLSAKQPLGVKAKVKAVKGKVFAMPSLVNHVP